MRELLYAARQRRKQPLLDTKVLTSWNALMIRALAVGGRVLAEPRYTQAAERAATFLVEKHRDQAGRLYRTSREGSAPKFAAFLDDASVEVITGVNLPMVIKLADQSPEDTLTEVARRIRDNGKDGIYLAGELLSAPAKTS